MILGLLLSLVNGQECGSGSWFTGFTVNSEVTIQAMDVDESIDMGEIIVAVGGTTANPSALPNLLTDNNSPAAFIALYTETSLSQNIPHAMVKYVTVTLSTNVVRTTGIHDLKYFRTTNAYG